MRKPVRMGLLAFMVGSLTGCAMGQPDSWAPVRPVSRRDGGTSSSGSRRFLPTAGQVAELPELAEESTLKDYLAYAMRKNPGLRAAFNRWKAALERTPQVSSLPDPMFTYVQFIREVETRVGPQERQLSLMQKFPWFGKLRLRGDAASKAAAAAYEEFEAARLDVVFRVEEVYYELYYLGQAIQIAKENLDLLKYFETVARARYTAAVATHAAVIKVQVEIGKLEDTLATLEDLKSPLEARLNAALNRPAETFVPFPKTIPPRRTAVTLNARELLKQYLDTPRLEALRHLVEKTEAEINLARLNYYPDLTVGVAWMQTDKAIMDTPESGKDPVLATLSINLPIWRKKYRAAERQARANHRSAVHTLQQQENDLASRIKMALYKHDDGRRKVTLYRDTLIPKATESLKSTEASFTAGATTLLTLIDAQRILLEFRLSYERALADRARALAELEMLVGKEVGRLAPGPGSMEADSSEESEKGGETEGGSVE